MSALKISSAIASCASVASSATDAAIFARHSTIPGKSSFAQWRSTTLPEVDARISVFVQCAAVKEICEA